MGIRPREASDAFTIQGAQKTAVSHKRLARHRT